MSDVKYVKISRRNINVTAGAIAKLRTDNKQLRKEVVGLEQVNKLAHNRLIDCERVLKCFISRGDHIEPSHIICLDFARELFK